MPKSKYFASLNEKGEIVLLTDATPPHELTENQLALSYLEYKLLMAVSSLDQAKKLIASVEHKLTTHLTEKKNASSSQP